MMQYSDVIREIMTQLGCMQAQEQAGRIRITIENKSLIQSTYKILSESNKHL